MSARAVSRPDEFGARVRVVKGIFNRAGRVVASRGQMGDFFGQRRRLGYASAVPIYFDHRVNACKVANAGDHLEVLD